MRRVAIYCRVSTADQSCDRQERDLVAFAARAGYEIVGIWKETASGARLDRKQRKQVMALAQRREIEAILVTELSRWGRSSADLIATLHELESWRVSLVTQTGGQFDLTTPQGKLFAGVLAILAEFERDLLRERILSGLANARAKGKQLGRPVGNPKLDYYAARVIKLVEEGRSYRSIAKELMLSKNSVVEIVKRCRAPKSKNN